MTINGFERIFTNNSEYAKPDGTPFMDSLAFTVQEFLYTDMAQDKEEDYRMDGRIKLYDFMTMTDYFVSALTTDLARATIKGYIEDIKQEKHSFYHEEKVECQKGALVITNASNELVLALLWTAYIYANALAQFQFPEKDFWKNAAIMLYELMKEYSFYKEEAFKEHLLIKQTRKAVQVMIHHIQVKISQKKANQMDEGKPQEEEEVIKSDDDVAEDITLHDKVRLDLMLRLMKDNGANLDKHGNKTKAAQLMQSITGLPLQTCKNYCSDPHLNTTTHSEEILKMNTLLQALGMKIHL